MINDSTKLIKGQTLKIDLNQVGDRLPKKLYEEICKNPIGILVGFKMVDGNQFGLVLKLNNSQTHWFFEQELSEIDNVSTSHQQTEKSK